ncbi:MAG: amino acid adenylation domain-containing protein [Clostridia bacterium]|nr:amino acid adenylation domain-containing protein [Clostridia bacterium]
MDKNIECVPDYENSKKKIRYYDLTNAQIGIWDSEKIYQGIGLYNFSASVAFKEDMDCHLLEKAINLFLEKNDGLRLRMFEAEGRPKQYISPYTFKEISVVDFSGSSSDEIQKWMESETRIPFNLLDSDLFKFVLINTGRNRLILYIKVHHIIMDGWSLYNIFINKLIRYYLCIKNGTDISEDTPSYLDYIESYCKSEEEYLSSEMYNTNREFWQKEFETVPSCSGLKPAKPGLINTASKLNLFELPAELSGKINSFCNYSGFSPYIVFFSALSIYINKVTSEKDVVLGSVALNRATDKEKEIFGMFACTFPVRLFIDEDVDFLTYLGGVKNKWKQVLTNQKYALNHIVKDYREKHNTSEKIYNIIMSYQQMKLNKKDMDYEAEVVYNMQQADSLRVHISNRDGNGRYKMEIENLVEMFSDEEIKRFCSHYSNLLNDAVMNPEKKISQLGIISQEERYKILFRFNNTKTEYPSSETVIRLFEKQVEKTPDNTALVYGTKQLTYRELNEKSNRLAHLLRQMGVERNSIVALLAERSIEMIIAMLSVIKAGGAYLPLEPKYPEGRISSILKDSGTDILLVQKDLSKDFEFEGNILDIEYGYSKGNDVNPETINSPTDLIYIMYTSGSTGKPKGVMVEHRNVIRLVKNTNYINLDENERILQTGAVAFDASTFEVWGALLNGGCLYLTGEDVLLDAGKLGEAIKKYGITTLWLTSPLFNMLAQQNEDMFAELKNLLVGGDVLSPRHINAVRSKCRQLNIINGYGPTENTTFSTCFHIEKEYSENIPIGRPISNSTVYIVDKHNNLMPVGVAGELCVGGDGLARGYLNKPELTAEKFVPDPFAKEIFQNHSLHPGSLITTGRMYKTGDYARWLPDGNIEFLGRIDNQVKIRGFRIEPGEIENRLAAHESVKNAVVTVKESNDGDKFLCAYIVSYKKKSVEELKEYLSSVLPYYMVPSYFIFLEELPLNQNGKVDIRALPEPANNNDYKHMEPASGLEKFLIKVWKKVIGDRQIGIHDNFFEAGGHSLHAMKLSSELNKLGISLKVSDIYEFKTIARISESIKENNAELPLCVHEILDENNRETEHKRNKILPSVVENIDNYSWHELNCFFRPMAIMYESYKSGYFEVFLFLTSYYCTHMVDGWFVNALESGIFYEFFEFHESIMAPKTGLSFKTNNYEDEADMHRKIREQLDSNCPVMVPGDLSALHYDKMYRRSSHKHFFIIKGYDEERKIYHILDNSHIDGGSSTIYKDFTIPFGEMYEMNMLYFKNMYPDFKKGHFWSLMQNRDLKCDSCSQIKLLKEHLLHLCTVRGNSSIINYPEYELFKRMGNRLTMEESENMLLVLNFKPVYHDLLYRFLKSAGVEHSTIDILKDFAGKASECWGDIRLGLYDAASGSTVDLNTLEVSIEKSIDLEKAFFKELEKVLFMIDLESLINKEEDERKSSLFFEKNYKKANIIKEKDKIRFEHSKHTTYATWDIEDNAPQLLINPATDNDFILSARVSIEGKVGDPYLSGLIVFLGNGTKFMYCLNTGRSLALFCPEKGESCNLYEKAFPGTDIYLKIEKDGNKIYFYSRKDKLSGWECNYEISEYGGVSSCGLFSITYEKIVYASQFTEIEYSIK